MKLTNKQKSILYVCVVLIVLLSLYANAFIKERNIEFIQTVNDEEISIY